MVWACENGHEVRRGMFHCAICKSSDVGEREVGAPRPDSGETTATRRRRDAEGRLNGFVTRGVGLCVAGVVLTGLALLLARSADGGDNLGFPIFLELIGLVVFVAGAGYALTGIVGWGVKVGNEATRAD